MALTFPRVPVVRFFLDRWRDVSSDIRQIPAITITHGRKDWAAKPSPALCKFTLDDGPDHGDGDYDPNNPMGQWYDYLSRNTPVTVNLHYGLDEFNRVSGSGWSTSPDMGAWSSFQSAGTLASDISGNNARHLVTSTTAFIAHYLPDVSAKDVDVYVEATLGAIDITGAEVELANLMVRGQSTGSAYYLLRATLSTTEQVQLRFNYAGSTNLTSAVSVLAYPGAASTVGFRFQVDGNTLRAKAWRTDTGEPLDWQVEYSLNPDTDPLLGAGWVGVRSGVATGNTNSKPVVFTYNNFTVELPRFAGETAKMVPKTSVDHADWRTEVECAAVRRRLSKGDKVLKSAIYRYLTDGNVPLVDYWPLDELPDTVPLGASAVSGGQLAQFLRETSNPLLPKGAIKWGAAGGLPSIVGAPVITNGGMLRLPVQTANIGNAWWSASWVQQISVDGGASTWLRVGGAAAQTGDVTFVWYTDGSYDVFEVDLVGGDVTLFSGTLPTPTAGTDGLWHTVALSVYSINSGADRGYHLAIDGILSTTTSGRIYEKATRWEAQVDPDTNWSGAWGHVAVFTELINAGTPDLAVTIDAAYRGWPSEHAGTRFARLCLEEGVSSSVVGNPATTPAMGPQRPLTLLKLTDECIDVDQGSGIDPRGAAGLGMRTHRATTAQDPVLTLQYEGQVAPEFAGTTDDQGTLNDVTAKRPTGGEYRIEQVTGPNNTADPGTNPQAAGRADTTVTTNVATDLNLPDQAGWRVHMGTVEGPRYATVTVDLAADDVVADPDLVAAVLDVEVDDRIDITGAAVRRVFDDVRLVARGYTETFNTAHQHKIVYNCSPYAPLNVGVYGDADSRRDTAGSSLTFGITSSATSFTVSVAKGQPWTTTAAQFPLDIVIGGERIRISSIAAPSSATPPLTQVFTVAASGRAINGVVKAHSAGAAVQLFDPVYHGH